MAPKWSNINLPGALHFVTGIFLNRWPVFTEEACCRVFLAELKNLNQNWPSKLITIKEMGWESGWYTYKKRKED